MWIEQAWNNYLTWMHTNFWPIACMLIVAILVTNFSNYFVTIIVRKTVGRLRNDVSKIDIKKRQDTLISLFSAVIKTILWLVVVFTILVLIGMDPTPLLASASVFAVTIGFGAQSIIKDFFSGLFIILENQYRVGDTVEIGESSGLVEQITIRSTIIRDADGNAHYIPNGTILHVINKTMGYSKINITLAVVPETDIDKVAKIIDTVGSEIAKEDRWKKMIIESPHFRNIGNSSETYLDIMVTGKTIPSKQWGVTNELRRRLLIAMKQNKIELAPPERSSDRNLDN